MDTAEDLYFPSAAPSVQAGGLILDIGAHAGLYAIEALRRNPKAFLIAVEPNPVVCQRLVQNLRANHMEERAEVVQALGPWSGTTVLEPGRSGSWGDRTHPRRAPEPNTRGITVRMVTIVDVLRGRTPVLAKCNAEGAEFEIFPQMFSAEIRPAFVILMTHPDEGSIGELVTLFRETGYEVVDADEPPKDSRFHCRL